MNTYTVRVCSAEHSSYIECCALWSWRLQCGGVGWANIGLVLGELMHKKMLSMGTSTSWMAVAVVVVNWWGSNGDWSKKVLQSLFGCWIGKIIEPETIGIWLSIYLCYLFTLINKGVHCGNYSSILPCGWMLWFELRIWHSLPYAISWMGFPAWVSFQYWIMQYLNYFRVTI